MEPQNYARQNFDNDLQELEHELLEMASVVEKMMSDASQALISLDRKLALQTIKQDDILCYLKNYFNNTKIVHLAVRLPIYHLSF